jgi:hypothetical protein
MAVPLLLLLLVVAVLGGVRETDLDSWTLWPEAKLNTSVAATSRLDFDASSWFRVSTPCTVRCSFCAIACSVCLQVLGGLIQNGVYSSDIYRGTALVRDCGRVQWSAVLCRRWVVVGSEWVVGSG